MSGPANNTTITPGVQPPSRIWSVYLKPTVELAMIGLSAGSFVMGGPPERKGLFGQTKREGTDAEYPRHPVTLSRDFWLGKYQVTQELWHHIMGKNPSAFLGPTRPVEKVSWNNCQEFVKRLNALNLQANGEPLLFRLPTEAEWEYACRAGSESKWFFGDQERLLTQYAWFASNSKRETHPVGLKKPNPWGFHDMYGNVWEWCQDVHGSYRDIHAHNPTGPDQGAGRSYRGGSWRSEASVSCRSSSRNGLAPGDSNYRLGFRLAADTKT